MRHASLKRPIWCVVCLLLLACRCQALDVISSSKLEKCVANGTQSNTTGTVVSCQQKVVVVVTVDSGDQIANQNIDFSLSCIGSPTGVCPCPCNYAIDPSCTCRDLASTLTVTLQKSQLWASYPLQYLQSFNYKPYEAIIRPGAGNCKAADYDTSPTCGWYYTAGVKVPNSQGFTCACDASQIWDETFGTNKQRTRANLDCDFFSDMLDIAIGRLPCSAHCLMMDPHWYGGYSLGESSMQFTINATLTYSDDSGSSSSEAISLSPAVPIAMSSKKTLSAKLMGDLAGYTSLPVLSEKVLMIPHPKQGQSPSDVFADRSEWMLLDRSKVSFDGNECDKVGTSFTAFRYQVSGCKRAVQTCLSNQLRDILEADKARVAGGKVPLYLVSQYTGQYAGLNSSLKSFAGGPLSFALPSKGITSSVVQLEAVADNIKLVTNVSPGAIVEARMCTFAETTCGGFEASASRGYLHAWLANRGNLVASYTLSVTNCSASITAVPAQRVVIEANSNGTLPTPFEIFVEDDAAVTSRYCWLYMYDSQGGVTNKREVPFFTNATNYEAWPTGGVQSNGTGVGTLDNVTCDNACNSRWDLICQARHGCWGKVGGIFGLVLGTIAGATALGFLALKLGWLTSLLQLCGGGTLLSGLGSCFGGGGGTNSAEKDTKSGKNAKDRRSKYELEDRDSASGGRGEQNRARKSGRHSGRSNSAAEGRHSRRSRSQGSIYETYESRYHNELYDEFEQQPPEMQQFERSSSRSYSGGKRVSKGFSRQGNRRESRIAGGAHSADEGLQMHHNNMYQMDMNEGAKMYSDEESGEYTMQNTYGGDKVGSYSPYKDDDSGVQPRKQFAKEDFDLYEEPGSLAGSSSTSTKKYGGSSSSRAASAVPWDESAAGGGGHVRTKHKAHHKGAGSESDEQSIFEESLQQGFAPSALNIDLEMADGAAHVSRSSHSRRISSSSSSRIAPGSSRPLPVPSASSPGRLTPAAAAAAAAGARGSVGSSRSRLSELVGNARSASKVFTEPDSELDPESGRELSRRQQQQQRRGYGSSSGDRQQQSPTMFTQPGRAVTSPGGLTTAAAGSNSSRARSSMSPQVRGRETKDTIRGLQQQQQQAAKSPAVLARSRDNSGEGVAIQPVSQVLQQLQQQQQQQQDQEFDMPISRMRSRQPLPDGSSSSDDRQQQQQQRYSAVHSSRISSSTLTRRHSAAGHAQQLEQAYDAAAQQQQQQQRQLLPAGSASPSRAGRVTADRQASSNAAILQQQQQQQLRAASSRKSAAVGGGPPTDTETDDFFLPYGSSVEPQQQQQQQQMRRSSRALEQQADLQQQQQSRMSQGGESLSSRRVSSSSVQQQQQQQQPLQRGMSAPGGTAAGIQSRSPPQQQQQQWPQRPVSKWVVLEAPVSTAARPHLAPFYDSTSGAAAAAADPAARSTSASGGSPSRGSVNPIPQQQLQSSVSRQTSAAGSSSSSSRMMTSEPGIVGRHRQSQQQKQQQYQGSGAPQQRPSVINLATRSPGFVRSAAAAAASSPGSSPVRASSSSSRVPGRSRQQDMDANLLFDEEE